MTPHPALDRHFRTALQAVRDRTLTQAAESAQTAIAHAEEVGELRAWAEIGRACVKALATGRSTGRAGDAVVPTIAAPDAILALLAKAIPPTTDERLAAVAADEGLSAQLADLRTADPWGYQDLLAACEDEWGLERVTKSDRSHLVRRIITNRLGRRQVVWVKPAEGEAPAGQSRGHAEEDDTASPRTLTREQVAESRTILANAVADPNKLNPEQLRDLAHHIDAITKEEAKGLLRVLGEKVGGKQMEVAKRLLEAVRAGREKGKGVGDALERAGRPKPTGQYGEWGRAAGDTGPEKPASRDEFPKRGLSPEEAAAEREKKQTAAKPADAPAGGEADPAPETPPHTAAPSPATSDTDADVQAVADLYHNASRSDAGEKLPDAIRRIESMGKAELVKLAAAINHRHARGDSAAKLRKELAARLDRIVGTHVRDSLAGPNPYVGPSNPASPTEPTPPAGGEGAPHTLTDDDGEPLTFTHPRSRGLLAEHAKLKAAGDEAGAKALEVALGNLHGDDDLPDHEHRRKAGRRLASVYHDAVRTGDERAARAAQSALTGEYVGAEAVGEHGATVPFDPLYHESDESVGRGEPVTVQRVGHRVKEGEGKEYVLARAKVSKVAPAGGTPTPAPASSAKIVRDVRGKMEISQQRAKTGGEEGPNGEWYPGGAFIATQDIPKRLKDKLKQKATGRVRVRDGHAVPEPGRMSIADKLGGTVMNPRDGSVNEQYLDHIKASPEERTMYADLAAKYKAGEDWVDVNDYPSLARLEDVARLYAAGKPVPGAVLDVLPAEYRERLKKWEPSTTTGA